LSEHKAKMIRLHAAAGKQEMLVVHGCCWKPKSLKSALPVGKWNAQRAHNCQKKTCPKIIKGEEYLLEKHQLITMMLTAKSLPKLRSSSEIRQLFLTIYFVVNSCL